MFSFVTAGVVVALGCFYVFWSRRVPHFLAQLGLDTREGTARVGQSIFVGLTAGLAAGVCGLVYLLTIEKLEWLRAFRDQMARVPTDILGWWWLAGLAVVAAPLCEEFIFRGVVHNGLRRSLPPGLAVPASAALFALVHNPLSAPPVFVLGVAAAISFERCRLLVAPIVAHMTYNALVLVASS